jgi:hypothetical protein
LQGIVSSYCEGACLEQQVAVDSQSVFIMPKYVRRQPLLERIKAYLNPYDFLLWLSEEIESNGWDQLEKEWAIPIGFSLNLIFLIARANSNPSQVYDDVFGDVPGVAWTSWLVRIISHLTRFIAHYGIRPALPSTSSLSSHL